MAYHRETHLAQMCAREVDEQLIMAQAAEGSTRAYHQQQALKAGGKLAAALHALAASAAAAEQVAA